MTQAPSSLEPIDPAALRPHYRAFLRPGRILLTGHSHQAWPDVARDGLSRAFEIAAEHVDDKWEHAFAAARGVREAITDRIGGHPDQYALGASTHELVVRLLSALDLRSRPRIVTSSGEFHSLDRQLRRLVEAGLEVRFVPASPVETLAERVAAELDARTALVALSTVLFETGAIVPALDAVREAAARHGVTVLFDAYHAFNVVPFRVDDWPEAFVVAGGYKYAQWGEGVCFLRVPPQCELRPLVTGWFADFETLEAPRGNGGVGYGRRGAERFAGATYDPSSHLRAVAVAEFFRAQRLDVPRLRALSLRQTGRLLDRLREAGFEVATPAEPDRRGGFVAVRVDDAARLVRALREQGVFADARGPLLRLGPAPYVTDDEIDAAVAHLCAVASR
ncbi:MAG: aminotransferase class V-fold PLP-dependent enzyme [Myxococcota bacterium]|nr:aminotransferase class V-fold PLP-dependent enzyme [Myxococcota bacterium]MDW8362662.1 aminotransferase class V-fold PLP-dependent enzyme [Myxococcales bacterium]